MKECNCTDTCTRWGIYGNKLGGFFCPYIPGVLDGTNECKQTIYQNMKPHLITEVENRIND